MRKTRVLVVEDDPAVSFILVDGLGFEGFEVLHAVDGLQALDLLPWPPDLILLDLDLPRLDGRGFRRAQLETPQRDIPIIVLSGAQLDSVADDLKAVAVIRKPFAIEELVATITAAAERA